MSDIPREVPKSPDRSNEGNRLHQEFLNSSRESVNPRDKSTMNDKVAMANFDMPGNFEEHMQAFSARVGALWKRLPADMQKEFFANNVSTDPANMANLDIMRKLT